MPPSSGPERFLRPVSPVVPPDEAALRATVERLAAVERPPCSPGEREVAHLIADRLRALGAVARVEEVPAYGSYAWPVGALAGLAALAGVAGGRSRALGTLGGAVAAAGLVDEIDYGRHVARTLLGRRRTACNVVADLGPRSAPRTLVVMAHHDAAPSGRVFGQTVVRPLARRVPRPPVNLPLWWPVVAGPALVALGSAAGMPRARRTGAALAALTAAAMADISARRAVPGANDGLSGVAVLVALAESLSRRPLPGVRVVLLSTGAAESLHEGMRGFAHAHFHDLTHGATWFLNAAAVGSGRLVLLDAEGPLRAAPYDAAFGDLVARCAVEQGIPLGRGVRSHTSTDAVVPQRHGFPAVSLSSVDEDGLVPHYHLPTDVPEHVDYGCVADAARLTESVARALALH
ncbi:M28 family peptidase [Actinomadura sp. NPDC047616]|uniref:M28 family peptidase n=1 Tax=Actinomadura sp. NPDC047616 TaxID=3155914 RepID=UPI0033D4D788